MPGRTEGTRAGRVPSLSMGISRAKSSRDGGSGAARGAAGPSDSLPGMGGGKMLTGLRAPGELGGGGCCASAAAAAGLGAAAEHEGTNGWIHLGIWGPRRWALGLLNGGGCCYRLFTRGRCSRRSGRAGFGGIIGRLAGRRMAHAYCGSHFNRMTAFAAGHTQGFSGDLIVGHLVSGLALVATEFHPEAR